MAAEKFPNMTGVTPLDAQLQTFVLGSAHIAKGSYGGKSAGQTVLVNKTAVKAELSANFDEVAEIAEKPGKIDSTAVELKSRRSSVQGKRTTKVELHFTGISNDRKDFFERELNKYDTIVVLQNAEQDGVMCFDGLRFVAKWTDELDGFGSVTLTTEFSGYSTDKIYTFFNLVEGV